MLQNATIGMNGVDGGIKAPSVISWSVVLAAPPLVVIRPQLSPSMAWRVRDNRMRASIHAGISTDIPRIDTGQVEIASIRLDKKGSDIMKGPTRRSSGAHDGGLSRRPLR
jgi:hypothetical protein